MRSFNISDNLVQSIEALYANSSTEKSKIIVNSTNNLSADIHMNGQRLEEVDKFKYLESTLSKDGSNSAEVCTINDKPSAAMARLDRVWKSNKISLPTKFRLYKSLVVPIPLYTCETWTLLAVSQKRIQAFKNKCDRRFPWISYIECKTNEYVRKRIHAMVGPQECLW